MGSFSETKILIIALFYEIIARSTKQRPISMLNALNNTHSERTVVKLLSNTYVSQEKESSMDNMDIGELFRGRDRHLALGRPKSTQLRARDSEKEMKSFWKKERFIMIPEELLMISMGNHQPTDVMIRNRKMRVWFCCGE
jgi:hypothetical protein